MADDQVCETASADEIRYLRRWLATGFDRWCDQNRSVGGVGLALGQACEGEIICRVLAVTNKLPPLAR